MRFARRFGVRLASALLVAGIAVLGQTGDGGAQEQRYPRVRAYSCDWLAGRMGADRVWSVWFKGARETIRDRIERTSVRGCFETQADCKAWLYWMQSDFPRMMNFGQCRRGIG